MNRQLCQNLNLLCFFFMSTCSTATLMDFILFLLLFVIPPCLSSHHHLVPSLLSNAPLKTIFRASAIGKDVSSEDS